MKKRTISLLVAIVLLIGLIQPIVVSAESATGECGDSLMWTLDGAGTLTISGAGEMYDYGLMFEWGDKLVPWYSRRESITSVIIEDGVTSIGSYAFDGCSNLTSINIPDTVITIGNYAFVNCVRLKSVTIPDSVISIGDGESGNTFRFCESLTNVTLGRNVTTLGFAVFFGCKSLSTISIPASVTTIHSSTFSRCDSLTDIVVEDGNQWYTSIDGVLFDKNVNTIIRYPIGKAQNSYTLPSGITTIGNDAFSNSRLHSVTFPNSLISIGESAFWSCKGLSNVVIPENVSGIADDAFAYCDNLASITIPDSIVSIGDGAFTYCNYLSDVYYVGTESQWKVISIGDDNSCLTDASIHYDTNSTDNADNTIKFRITTDHTSLSVRKNSKILLGAGLFSNGVQIEDVSGITFQIEDASVIEVTASYVKDNYLYASFNGLKEGTTNVLFNDSNSGAVVMIPVTVYSNSNLCYTLSSVPTQEIDKYPTNFYNVNGLYIDSYTYTVNADKSASVSFDVYNSNYMYGAVEIYDVNGNLKNAVLIDKMSSSMTSMKEVLWNDVVYLVRDIWDGDLISYRQESGFSKKTNIAVTIPENGYIKICNDPENSFIVGLVNSVDLLMSLSSFMGEISGYDSNSSEFSTKLTSKLVTEKVFAEFVKDGSKLPKKLWSNIGKEIISSPEALVSFSETVVQNITDLELEDVIISTAADFGINVGEETFTYFAGPFGAALKGIFAIGEVENILVQHAHMTQSAGIGSIYIQNQGGGVLGSQQITVESDIGFESDTALRVFSVAIDSELLSKIEEINPKLYEAISNNSSYTYDISLLKNGEETQLSGKITVCIPIPEAWRVPMPNDLKESIYAGMFKIYRLEEDGSTTEMPIDIKDGCFVFETDHFSLYSLVKYDMRIPKLPDNNPDVEGDPLTNWMIPSLVIAVIGCSVLVAFCIVRSKKKKKD